MKHVKNFEDWRINENLTNEAKFFDPEFVDAISEEIADNKIDTIQFLGFEWQYRINGVVANVKAFSNGKDVTDNTELSYSGTIAEYFRPAIKKGYHDGIEGSYIIKKFSKWPEVKLLDQDGKVITDQTGYDVEENSDS